MRIIFIEGVSGVGKTTTAQRICDILRERGYSVHAYLEFDFDNPIDFYCTAYFKQDDYDFLLSRYIDHSEAIRNNTIIADDVRLVRYYNRETPIFEEPLLRVLREHEFCWKPINLVPISEYTRVFKSIWEQFAESANPHDFVIFDGSLLHHPINDMMRNYSVTAEQAICHVNTLLKTVEPLNPLVVYLSSENVAERLEKARISRNQASASNEQVRFWDERKQMDITVIQKLTIPCDVFDISQENWEIETDVMIKRIFKE